MNNLVIAILIEHAYMYLYYFQIQKIKLLNKTLIYFEQLQSDATELAREALECEAKEEKLVTDAVKHLNQANLQIHSMSKRIIGKSEESQKQKQDIANLLKEVKTMELSHHI